VCGGARLARVNNAGTNAYKYGLLAEACDADLVDIVQTNVLGVMLGCKEARMPRSRARSRRPPGGGGGAAALGSRAPRPHARLHACRAVQAVLRMWLSGCGPGRRPGCPGRR